MSTYGNLLKELPSEASQVRPHFVDPSLSREARPNAAAAKEWFVKRAVEYAARWAEEQLKAALGAEHLSEVDPEAIWLWAVDQGLQHTLPRMWDEFKVNERAVNHG